MQHIFPGLGYASSLALVAWLLQEYSGVRSLNLLTIAMLLGAIAGNTLGVPQRCLPGIQFAIKRLLRVAIALLGVQLSLQQMATMGFVGVVAIATSTVCTFYFTMWAGAKLGVSPSLSRAIGAGTSICGASAVVATNAVTNAPEEDTTYSVALISGFGTIAMLVYPLLAGLLQLSSSSFGIWCGASIHEIGQVIVASFQESAASGEMATIVKLSRVMLLIPFLLWLSFSRRSSSQAAGSHSRPGTIPWFAIACFALACGNSFGWFALAPLNTLRDVSIFCNQALLAISLAAMGSATNFQKIVRAGIKPIYLACLSWLFIASTSLILVSILY